ncbi:hypothetical protein [Streptomyces sp. NPDC000618]|uniref:hypothetical protein n=1 Tax=Streptomyces sp. NPDC000618 TaxID=3154265 RepID=UPI0033347410
MSDTSLVFNLVTRDNTEAGLSSARERFDSVATGIGATAGAALGVSLVESISIDQANDKLAAQLGLTESESARIGGVAGDLYADAYGDSMEQVNTAVGAVMSSIKGMATASSADLEDATAKALNFASAFDIEVDRAVQSVGTLINSGLATDATQAFDLITAASQKVPASLREDVLDASDEYSQFFRTLGYSGEQAFALLVDSSSKGAFGIDKAGDAIKEFTLLSTDLGSGSVQAAYKAIGLNAHDMANAILTGGDSAQGATQKIIDGLLGIDDPAARAAAAVGLFGTPLEDMNKADIPQFLQSLKGASGAMDGFGGAAKRSGDALNDNAAAALTEFKRKAMSELTAVTGGFLAFAMDNQAVFKPLALTLAGLAGTVLVVKAAMITYSAVSSVVAAANAAITWSGWGVTATWIRMNAIGVAAYARIAIGAVASAATTAAAWTGSALVSIGTWILAVIRAGAVAAGQFLLMAAKAVAWAAVMAAQWLIAMGPVGWVIALLIGLTVLIIAKWDTIKAYTAAAWGWVWAKVQGAVAGILGAVGYLAALPGRVGGWFGRMKDAAVAKGISLANWVRGLPGRILGMLGNLGSLLWNAGGSLISGFINGIMAKLGSVKDAASSIVSAARDFFPFSPAKEGPFSGTGYTSYSGAALVEGFQQGIISQIPALRSVLDGLPGVSPHPVQTPLTAGMATSLGASAGGGAQRLIVDVRGADEDLKRLFRKIVRLDGGGSTGNAFDRRR